MKLCDELYVKACEKQIAHGSLTANVIEYYYIIYQRCGYVQLKERWNVWP